MRLVCKCLVFRLLGALCLTVAVAACSSSAKRAEPGPLPVASAPLAVRTAWTYSLAPAAAPLQAAVIGTRVVLASDSGVLAEIDAETGQSAWRVDLGAKLSAGVGSDGRHHAVVTADNQLLVMQGDQRLWQQKLPAQTLTPPLVAGQRVFVLTADRTLLAFDGASGQRLWQQQRTVSDALVLGQAGVLTAVGDTLVVGWGGRLAGINPLNGQSRWETVVGSSRGTNEVERLVDLVVGVSRQGQVVCARSFQTALACVDTSRGVTLWSRPAQGHQGLEGDEVRVYGVESDSRLKAWNRRDGQAAWSEDQYRFRELTAPRLWGGTLVFGDGQGLVHWLDRENGKTLQRRSTDGSPFSLRPVVAGQTLVTVNRSGLVTGWRMD